METILWKLEQDFKEELERRKNIAKYDGITIKELLDLGFNNNYLKKSNDIVEICLGWLNLDGTYSKKLTDEQLNVKVKMEEDFDYYEDEELDLDGYHIAKVICLNSEDEKLFNEDE